MGRCRGDLEFVDRRVRHLPLLDSVGWADGYGYGWWTRTYILPSGPIDTYFAAGWGEQHIIVVPELDMVAVFTGGAYEYSAFLSPGQMMAEYILPAARNGP